MSRAISSSFFLDYWPALCHHVHEIATAFSHSQGVSEKIVNISSALENLRKARGLSWGDLCGLLDIKRSMLHYLRNGERQPSPKLLRRIEMLEAESGLRTFPSPSREPVLRLRHYQLVNQVDWSEIAGSLGMDVAAIESVLLGRRALTEKELEKLAQLEAASFITLPTAGPEPSPSVQRPDAADANPSNERKSSSKTVPTPEYALAADLHRLEEKLDEMLKLLKGIAQKGKK